MSVGVRAVALSRDRLRKFWWAWLAYWVVPATTAVVSDQKEVLVAQLVLAAYFTFLAGGLYVQRLQMLGRQGRVVFLELDEANEGDQRP
jgi:hypothetical protein